MRTTNDAWSRDRSSGSDDFYRATTALRCESKTTETCAQRAHESRVSHAEINVPRLESISTCLEMVVYHVVANGGTG